jgi:sec-independent protein translocase protein TatC
VDYRRRVLARFSLLLPAFREHPVLVKADLLQNIQLVILAPLEAVSVKVQISLVLGFIISLPVLVYEFWGFFGPALSPKEKRMIAWALMPSTLLFLVGASFAYKVLLPLTISMMVGEAYPVALPMLSLDETMSFIVFVVVSTGVSFELPLVVWVLTKAGLVDYRMLSSLRRHVIVLIFIFAAVITPDVTFVSQTLIAIPMVLLYEASIWVARFTS